MLSEKNPNQTLGSTNLRTSIGCLSLLAVVGLISLATSYWSAQIVLPPAAVYLTVHDEMGNGIEGATFRLQEGRPTRSAPVVLQDVLVVDSQPITDQGGNLRLVLPQAERWGASGPMLFWVIPVERKYPHPLEKCIITARGYRPVRLSFGSMIRSSRDHVAPTETFLGFDGLEHEVPVYYHTVILKDAGR